MSKSLFIFSLFTLLSLSLCNLFNQFDYLNQGNDWTDSHCVSASKYGNPNLSPMDFDPNKSVDFPNYYYFFPQYSYNEAAIFPQNITVEVNATGQPAQFGQAYTIVAGNQIGIFAASSMRIHSEAEHTIQGKRYPVELQIYHAAQNIDPTLISKGYANLFVSVFFDNTTDSTSNDLLANITQALTNGASTVGIDLSYLFDFESNILPVYSYSGTQTFPPCNPAVWFVFPQAIHASSEQIQQIYDLYHHDGFAGSGNYRAIPVQPATAAGFYAFNMNNQQKPQTLEEL